MAEERNVGLARATADTALDAPATGGTAATNDEGLSKEDLQRRMEQARESITQTVSEIKDTVTTQYQSVVESLDWREQYKRRPVAFSLGAAGVGLLVGYGVTGMFKGDGRDDEDDYDYEEMDSDGYDYDVPESYAGQAYSSPSAKRLGAMQSRSYAATPPPTMTATTSASTASAPSYADSNEQKDDSPGLLERFKGTTAYERLMDEVSALGGRAVDELSHTAQNVVLPMLLSKVKDMVGIDLNTQKKQAERSKIESEASKAHAAGVRSSQETAETQQDG